MEEKKEKINIWYSEKNKKIPDQLKKLLVKVVENDENYEFVFVDDKNIEIKNYQEKQSYKALTENFSHLVQNAKETKKKIEDKLKELEETIREK